MHFSEKMHASAREELDGSELRLQSELVSASELLVLLEDEAAVENGDNITKSTFLKSVVSTAILG